MQFSLCSRQHDSIGAAQRISARFALAPRLTLDVSGYGRRHFAGVHIKLADPAANSELTASEWAARFGPRVLPAPGAVRLARGKQAFDEHGLGIEFSSRGRSHILYAELRRWEEGSTEWSAPPAPWEHASFHRLY
jgi:hypothetical protein